MDSNGKIFVTGRGIGADNDYGTIKYDADGNLEWIKRFRDNSPPSDDRAVTLVTDIEGSVYVTDMSWQTNNSDYATVKYNAAGNEIWAMCYNNDALDGSDIPAAIAVQSDGSIYVNGRSTNIRGNTDITTIRYVQTGNETSSKVFTPTDDAYVQSSSPTANFGTRPALRVRKSSSDVLNSYLKFNVTELSGTLLSAKLRLYVKHAGTDGGSVYSVSNNYQGTNTPWMQSGLNWNKAPAISGVVLAVAGKAIVNSWEELEVTAAITGNGVYSFALKNNASDVVYYSSKEGSNKPELVIVTSGAQTQPSLSINDVNVTEGDNGTVNANFTVRLSAASNQTVTVNVTTANGTASAGSDYMALSSTQLTFPPMTTTKPVSVVVNGDVLDESNETFFVNLFNQTNTTIEDGQGIGTIVDDDATGGGATVVFRPTEDSYVQASNPTANFATRTFLRQRQSGSENIYSYLKFAVSGLNGSVLNAKLRLYVTNESTTGGSAYSVSNNYKGTSTAWAQSGLNWNNAPVISGTALSSAGAVTLNSWVEFDVTAAITGNGVYSFGMKNGASDFVDYSSKEGSNKPELVIQTSGSSLASIATDAVTEEEILPEQFRLSPNYPNPFNAGTTIAYALPQEGNVRLVIYNMLGQMVRKLIDENQTPGHKRVLWDGADERGLRVGSGVYFYRIEFGQQRLVGKMILQQ